jgi:DNA-directed RNA polymerase specialized sigma24 family protein
MSFFADESCADVRPEGGASIAAALEDELRALLLEIRARSGVSFELLYVMTSGSLFAVVSKVKFERAEAEAVLQDVYANVWHECDCFDAENDAPSEWLQALARRTALNSTRHRSQPADGRLQAESRPPRLYPVRGSDLPEPFDIVVRGGPVDRTELERAP